MFANRRMNSKETIKIEDGNKIYIPEKTGAIAGESVAIELVKCAADNYLRFHSKDRIFKVLKNAEEALNKARTKEEYDQINADIELLIEAYESSEKIDEKNRLAIDSNLLRKIPEADEYELEFLGYTASLRAIRKSGR